MATVNVKFEKVKNASATCNMWVLPVCPVCKRPHYFTAGAKGANATTIANSLAAGGTLPCTNGAVSFREAGK